VHPTGKVTISGTKVHRNGHSGMVVQGEATIKDSSITANGDSGVVAWKVGGSKGIVTVGEDVECSGNNTSTNPPHCADYKADEAGTFKGLPGHLVLFESAVY